MNDPSATVNVPPPSYREAQVLSDAPSRAGRGALVAMVVVGLGLLGVGGMLVSRVKQAHVKQEAVASERAAAQAAILKKPPAEITHAVPTQWKPRVELTGTLKPWREGDVAFTLGGQLLTINVRVGDTVRPMQVLATLDQTRVAAEVGVEQAKVRAAQSSVALAEDKWKRSQELAKTNAIPQAQADEDREQVALAKAQLEAATAQARVAQTGQGQHAIYAPFAGVVTKAPTAIGQVLRPAESIMRIEDLSRFRLSASIGEEDVSIMKVGAPVQVTYRDRVVTGHVTALVPSLDQATRRAPIEIQVDNDPKNPLLAYGFVHATAQGDKEIPVLRLPASARRPGSQDEIVKVVDGKAHVLHVPHAVDTDGSWMVLRGLRADDAIVLSPDVDVKDGDPIELAK